MRWLSFGERGGERPGVLLDGERVLDLAGEWPDWPRSWRGLLAAGLAPLIRLEIARGRFHEWHVRRLADLILAPPIPDPSKVIALGRNYPAHAAEQNRPPSMVPLPFAKAPSCLIGCGADVVVPAHESRPDCEAEMALVIGRPAREVREAEALACVAGITAFNDVSGREAQFADRLWLRGKSYDTFGPLGPWVAELEDIGDPDDLGLAMTVNGEVRQQARTAEMTAGCARLVSWISQQMTLLPGDVIATGTPAGVGVFRDPPIFLQDGDRMEVRLEGVGVLHNRVVRKAPAG
ncbi:MAG: fumarylacetoacetate hydrolase family protein [Candidatus Eisenbacteria bacterium]